MTSANPDITSPATVADRSRVLATEFRLAADLIYLNHAALGPWPQRTVAAVSQFAAENGRDGSRGWKQWYAAEQRLRQRLARLLNAAGPADLALLKNTSEALSTVANGIAWQPGDQVLTLAEEFPSNLWPWQQAADESPLTVRTVARRPDQSTHQALIEASDSQTTLIAVSSVQYATGHAADLEALGRHCQQNGIIFVVDAIQSLGALTVDVRGWHIDALAAGSHKWLLAPEGTGVLYTSAQLRDRLHHRQAGWRMTADPFSFSTNRSAVATDSRRFEIGTLNTLGIMGLDASLSLYEELGAEWVEHTVCANARRLRNGLESLAVDLATPADTARPGGIVSFKMREPATTQAVFKKLSEQGVMSALRDGWLRLSPHYYTPAHQLDGVLSTIRQLA